MTLEKLKQSRLEKAGWRIGTAADFLGLTDEEAAYIDLKITLSELLRTTRTEKGLSQVQLAKLLGSSQSRVAKMEASDQSVSLDLILRGLIAMGTHPSVLGQAIAATQPRMVDRSSPTSSQPKPTKRAPSASSRTTTPRSKAA